MELKKRGLFTGGIAIVVLMFMMASCGGSDSQPGSVNPHASAQVADTIQLGEIDWLVISVQNNRALVLSKYVLETRAYHIYGGEVTWEHSSLRTFLNGSFFGTTFSEQDNSVATLGGVRPALWLDLSS